MNGARTLSPLGGITVLDLTSLPPGAACTVLLADLGADVIRIEPPALGGKRSLLFGQVALSRGKRSMTLDMRNAEAAAVLARLVARADVVIENAMPGAMEQRGFGYAQARAANPAIIWCAITGFGQTGPYASYSGHDLSFLAHSGLLAALSVDLPWHPGQGLALPAAALTAAMAIQAALLQRARTGEGAFVDVSLSEAAGWFLTCGINALSAAPPILAATPDRRLYRCADGRFVAVACAEPRTWAALCDGLGLSELKAELNRRDSAEATTHTLAERFASRPAHEWVRLLAPAGLAVTVVNRGEQVAADEHAMARGSIAMIGDVPVPANPVRLATGSGAATATSPAPPPLVGEHTDAVLAAAGFGAAEIAALRDGNPL